ncbi:Arp2/3 complex 16 kDa subunit ARPC5, partial [Thelephora ganbajun]
NLNIRALVSILNSTKLVEGSNVLKSLSPDAQDSLIKHSYKGMTMPGWGDVSGSVLLGWHEEVRGIAGTGFIIRVIIDRRTV